ncbi:penicillin-binding protein 1A [Algibacillus agarilyticus]|uniref:penicillin-binding protein 1A n=1 Tax=Algibacillus agarilyticus TaxID=2234133 RepID=UPI001E5725B3|nr:penicillin-binding protein 1A [Algibacillus agarilyticus]
MTKFFRILFYLTLSGILFTVLTITSIYYYIKDELPSVQKLQDIQLQTPMRVYTSDGLLISQFGEKKRIPVTLADVPEHMIQALLAAEDARFYEHPGVDFIGLVRSAIAVVSAGGKRTQGASTITMQVARNFFLTREKTYIRKIKEIFIAFHIENLLSKDEILTLYLNKNELGNRAFGVGAAAEVLYGKKAIDLTLPQSAMIIGLHKAPSTYNPLRRPVKAKQRRDTVLWRMKDAGYLNESEYTKAIETPITAKFHGAQIDVDAPYVAEMVRQHMIEQYGDQAYTAGFDVYTTVTANSQLAVQKALRDNMHAYDERHGYRGPLQELWQGGAEEPWAVTDIRSALQALPAFGDLTNVVITQVDLENNSFSFIDEMSQTGIVGWEDIKWARSYVSDTMQGKEPNSIQDILSVGQIVRIRKNNAGDWRLAQLPDVSAALVSLDPDNGAIRALIGGYDFRQSEYNRVTQAKRQVGSNIKPFIYSAALENGFTLASIVNDAPINQWDRRQGTVWRPKNSPAVYDGPIRIRQALAKSKNVVSVRLLRSIGIPTVVDYLTRFGFSPHEISANESLALGSASFTPLEVATAFTTFANGGYLVEPYFIERIESQTNELIWEANPPLACLACRLKQEAELQLQSEDAFFKNQYDQSTKEKPVKEYLQAPQVISEQNAFLIAEAMKSTVWGGGNWNKGTGWNGTAWRAQKLKRRDIGGKTGTTNDAKDAWFSGITPKEVITSWVGFDDHSRVLGQSKYNNNLDRNQIYGTEFGAKTALPAWIDYAKEILQDVDNSAKHMPANIVTVRIDNTSGKLSNKTDHTTQFEYFIKGTEPTEFVERSPDVDILTAEQEGEVSEGADEGIF